MTCGVDTWLAAWAGAAVGIVGMLLLYSSLKGK